MLIKFDLSDLNTGRGAGVRFEYAEMALHDSSGWASVSYTINAKMQPATLLSFNKKQFTDIADRSLTHVQLNYFKESASMLIENLEARVNNRHVFSDEILRLSAKRLQLLKELENIDQKIATCLGKIDFL